jgi:hypothetical protein
VKELQTISTDTSEPCFGFNDEPFGVTFSERCNGWNSIGHCVANIASKERYERQIIGRRQILDTMRVPVA